MRLSILGDYFSLNAKLDSPALLSCFPIHVSTPAWLGLAMKPMRAHAVELRERHEKHRTWPSGECLSQDMQPPSPFLVSLGFR